MYERMRCPLRLWRGPVLQSLASLNLIIQIDDASPVYQFCLTLQAQDALPHALRPLSAVQARGFADAAYSHIPPGRNHLAVPGAQSPLCFPGYL